VHARSRRGFADGLRIVAIILAAFDERFDILRRDQPHPMAQGLKRTAPIMRPATSFHRHSDGRQLGEEGHQILPPQIAAQNRLVSRIDRVKRENRF